MAEAVLEEQKNKKISRRDFLKLFGVGATALATPNILRWGIEQLATKEDRISRLALAAEIQSGTFKMERVGRIKTLSELKESLMNAVEALKGVSEAQVFIVDGEEITSLQYGTDSEIIFPASVIKIPICYEAWKAGHQDKKDYLTDEYADQILQKSYTFKNMVMQLPLAQGKTPEQLEEVVRILLEKAQISPKNKKGELPLKVNIRSLFDYLRSMNMPEIMKRAMHQTEEDKGKNYGAADVLLDTLDTDIPAYFKIGLVYDEEQKTKELVNSYYFQIGDNLKVLGYAKGADLSDVHEQMLQVAARISSFAVNK